MEDSESSKLNNGLFLDVKNKVVDSSCSSRLHSSSSSSLLFSFSSNSEEEERDVKGSKRHVECEEGVLEKNTISSSSYQNKNLHHSYGTTTDDVMETGLSQEDGRDAPRTPHNSDLDKSISVFDQNVEMTEGISQPLILRTTTPGSESSKGASLWNRLKEKRDSYVFHHSQSLEYDDLEDLDENDVDKRKMQLSQRITNEIRNGLEFTLGQCLAAILGYLVIAVVAYSFLFEKWSIVDSLYFACVTFTTIGYGDLVPSSDSSRLFTALFALSGVACLGIALGVLGSNLIEAQVKTVDRARNMSQYQVMTLFDGSQQEQECEEDAEQDEDNKPQEQTSPWYRSEFVLRVLPQFSLLLICCALLGRYSGWNFVSTFYFCIISASTVGFGDLTPQTQTERLVAVLFIPLAVGAMGHWLSMVSNTIMERRQQEFRKAFEARELTIHDLQVMDDDGDGKVTRAEYLEFMLVAMNKVDKDLICDLRAQFDRLDVDGTGILEKEDLMIAAKRKLKSPKRKLELALYKQQLLSVGNGDDKCSDSNKSPFDGILDSLYQR